MERIWIVVLTSAFTGILAFMIANTTIGILIPVFDDVALSMPNAINYTTTKSIIVNTVFTAIYIVVCIPFAYLLTRLLKREPEPQQQATGWY